MRFILLLLLLLFSALGHSAVDGTPFPLQITSAPRQPIHKQAFAYYHDATGRMRLQDVEQAYVRQQFAIPSSDTPSFGFIDGAVWVRFELENPDNSEVERWIESDWHFQQQTDLYLISAAGIQVQTNGSQVEISRRPLPSHQILFSLALQPHEKKTAFLRLSGKTPTLLKLELWQPAAYADNRERSSAIRYLTLASLLVFIVFTLLTWQNLRRPLLLMGVVSDSLLIVLILALDGLLLGVLLPAGSQLWQSRTGSLLTFLVIATHLLFTMDFLEVKRRHPKLYRLFLLLVGTSLAGGLVFFIHLAMPAAILLQLVLIATLVCTSLYMSFFGSRNAQVYLLAWGLMWFFLGLRNFSLLGLLPAAPLIREFGVFGMVFSSLVLSYVLFMDIKRLRQEKEAFQRERDDSQLHLMEYLAQEHVKLEKAVEARTRELEVAKSEAESSNLTKSGLILMINHELRAPLHTILGYAHLLRNEIPPRQLYRMSIIESSGRQLLRLIDDLLNFSSGEANAIQLVMEPVNLQEMIDHIKDSFQLIAAKKNNLLIFELDQNLPIMVETDRHRLMQVLQNLIGNACKFTHNGKIIVRISLVPSEDLEASECQRVKFSVIDNGIGIEKDLQGRIFDIFVRGDQSQRQPGVGLGLPIARQIVRSMGGDISVESKPEKGSYFSFTIKLKLIRDNSSSTRPIPRIIGYHGAPKTVLIVDDIQENRDFLHAICTRWKITPVLAQNGNEAFEILDSGRERIDAVLVDQFMPVFDGWDFLLLAQTAKSNVGVPIVLLSAAHPQRPPGFPEELEFDALIMKPVLPDNLADLLASILQIEWIYDVSSPAQTYKESNLHYPSDEDMEQLQRELAQGRIPAIEHRLETMLEMNPDCAAFINHALLLCQRLDLKGLEKLFSES